MTEADPPRDDLRRRAFGALASTSVVVVVDRTVQILLLSVVARLVSPEQTAVAAAVSLIVSMATLIANMGIGAALVQLPKLSGASEAAARSILVVTGLCGIALLQIAAPLSEQWFNNPDITTGLRVGSLILLLNPFATVANGYLVRHLRARDAATADLVSSLVGMGGVITLALLGAEFWSLVIGALIQGAVRTLLLCLFARQTIAFGRDGVQGVILIRKGLGFMSNALLNRAGYDAPRWLVGRYLPNPALGFYTRATGLMAYPASLFSAIAERVIFPAVGMVQLDRQRLRKGVIEAVQLTSLVGLPLTVFMFILGPDVIRVVLGGNWEGAIAPFRILSLAIYLRIGDRLTWTILRGMGRTTILSALEIVTISLLVAGCAFGSRSGLPGVSAAVVTVMTMSYLVTAVVSMSSVGVSAGQWLLAHRPAVMSSILLAAVLTPISFCFQALGCPAILVLAACVVATVVTAAAVARFAAGVFIGHAGQRLLRMAAEFLVRR